MNLLEVTSGSTLPNVSETVVPLLSDAITQCVGVAKDLLPVIIGATLLFAAFKMVPKFINKFASRIG